MKRRTSEFDVYRLRDVVVATLGLVLCALAAMAVRLDSRGPVFFRQVRVGRHGQLFRIHKFRTRGDRAVVGPRPEVPDYVACWPAELRPIILSIRPGMTDPASIAFRHEVDLLAGSSDPERTYLDEVLPAKAAACAEYVSERSFWGDLGIILRTVITVLTPPSVSGTVRSADPRNGVAIA